MLDGHRVDGEVGPGDGVLGIGSGAEIVWKIVVGQVAGVAVDGVDVRDEGRVAEEEDDVAVGELTGDEGRHRGPEGATTEDDDFLDVVEVLHTVQGGWRRGWGRGSKGREVGDQRRRGEAMGGGYEPRWLYALRPP